MERYSKQWKMHELITDTQAYLNQFTAAPQYKSGTMIMLDMAIRYHQNCLQQHWKTFFKKLPWNKKGICIYGKYLSHLRFGDDIVLMSSDVTELQDMQCQLSKTSIEVGMKMDLSKAKKYSATT